MITDIRNLYSQRKDMVETVLHRNSQGNDGQEHRRHGARELGFAGNRKTANQQPGQFPWLPIGVVGRLHLIFFSPLPFISSTSPSLPPLQALYLLVCNVNQPSLHSTCKMSAPAAFSDISKAANDVCFSNLTRLS